VTQTKVKIFPFEINDREYFTSNCFKKKGSLKLPSFIKFNLLSQFTPNEAVEQRIK
jgi:hypothetical protein